MKQSDTIRKRRFHKECWLCEVPLEWARKGICHSMFDRAQCFWVPTLRDYSPSIALRMRAERMAPHMSETR